MLTPEQIEEIERNGSVDPGPTIDALIRHIREQEGLLRGLVSAMEDHSPGRILRYIAEAKAAGLIGGEGR